MASLLDTFKFWKTSPEDKRELKSEQETVFTEDDGAIQVRGTHSSYYVDLEFNYDDQPQLIRKYRDTAMLSDVDFAIDEIINESVNFDDGDTSPIELNLDQVEASDNIKKIIVEEYNYILRLMNFSTEGYEQFREWYIDGRAFYHKVVKSNNMRKGIIAIRKFDSQTMKRIKEIEKDPQTSKIKNIQEYFLFDERVVQRKKTRGIDYFQGDKVIKFPKESVAYVDSGMTDPETGYIISHLHKVMKPANQLALLEDSSVIYRLSRAPERRIFYVDVGNLPKTKAEEYVKSIMRNYKNKISYDTTTGTVVDKNHQMSMLEDIWLPRKNAKGTEVSTLPGGQNLGEIADIEYFQRKLYKALNVPQSRLNSSEAVIQIGGASEITRDELKFSKFVQRLRNKYNLLFLDFLQTQLILKKIITDAEWQTIKDEIKFVYNQDLYITEQKETELLTQRTELAGGLEGFIGKYVSHDYIRKVILKQTDEDVMNIDQQIKDEKTDERYVDIEPEEGEEGEEGEVSSEPTPVQIVEPDDNEEKEDDKQQE